MIIVPIHNRPAAWDIVLAEYCFTEWFPIVKSNELRAERMNNPRGLKPSELSANLPSPLSHILADIIRYILKQSPIIAFIAGETLSYGYLFDNGQHQCDVCIFYTH